MSNTIKFLVPDFNKSIPDKVNDDIEVVSRTVLLPPGAQAGYRTAIATNGFPSRVDGSYMFALKLLQAKSGILKIGFTDIKTFDSTQSAILGEGSITGMGLHPYLGCFHLCSPRYVLKKITDKAKEIVSVLTISENGAKKQMRWIIDGNEGGLVDCSHFFRSGEDEIFPCISLCRPGQKVEFIPFDQITSRSPKIYDFVEVCGEPQNLQQVPSTKITITVGEQKESGRRRQRVEDDEQETTENKKPNAASKKK